MACTLFVLSLALHLGWLAQPNEVVFDEVHYGKYVSGYLTGEYFFNNHPPLGKLMVAGVAWLAGVTPTFGFRRIGAPYPNHQFIWLRLLPALCGAVLVPLVYLVALRSARSRAAATIAGMFVLLDNALLVQSKFLLLDAFVLMFGFLSLYLFWQSRLFFADGRWGAWAALGAAVAAGLCMATKWTGLGFWSLLLVFGGYRVVSKFWRGDAGRAVACRAFAALLAVPLVLYIAVFFLHFALLPKPGPGNRFMTPRFKASQAAGYPLRDFPANVWEVNRTMYVTHVHLTAKHPYSSRWYAWPLMMRPIAYWTKEVQTASGQRSCAADRPPWESVCLVDIHGTDRHLCAGAGAQARAAGQPWVLCPAASEHRGGRSEAHRLCRGLAGGGVHRESAAVCLGQPHDVSLLLFALTDFLHSHC